MGRARGLVGTAVLLMSLLGCGDGERIGACRRVDPSDADRSEPLSASVPPGARWIIIQSYTSVGDPADPPTDRTVEVRATVAGEQVDVYMHDLTAEDLEAAGTPVSALVQPMSRYDPYVLESFAVIDGDVAFLGECEDRATEVLARVAAHLGRDDAELMEEYVARGKDSELSRELG